MNSFVSAKMKEKNEREICPEKNYHFYIINGLKMKNNNNYLKITCKGKY